MGNHFHVLLDTPEPNLVAGMKWFLGIYSQGWNRRRQRHGHVFQGRYKAVVVNGEERDGSYFKIVADYIHLNPVRSGMVGGGTGKRLRSWRWNSFPSYAGSKVPDWLETGRVLRAFQLSEDRRGGKAYGGYLEARAKDPESAINDAALGELRRGWVLGEKSFVENLLATLGRQELAAKKQKGSVGGDAVKAHDEAEAGKIATAALNMLGLPGDPKQLAGRGKWLPEKALIAAVIRKRTGAGNRWIARRMGMGQESSVIRAVRRTKENASDAKRMRKLEKQLMADYRD